MRYALIENDVVTNIIEMNKRNEQYTELCALIESVYAE